MIAILPLTSAYEFAKQNGLAEEIALIEHLSATNLIYTSTVKRSYVVDLFRKHRVLKRFIKERWPEGLGTHGEREIDRYQRKRSEFEAETHQKRFSEVKAQRSKSVRR